MNIEKFATFNPGMVWLGLQAMWLIFIALVWTMVWKGVALWKAAREGKSGWFVALLIVNTLGILDILYIFVFSKKMREIK